MLKKFAIAAVLVAAVGSNAAVAGTSTVQVIGGTIGVTANVVSSCTTAANTAVGFGTLTGPVASVVETTPGVINITCDTGTEYAIGLGQGGFFGAGTRNMFSAGNVLPYELFTDGARTTAFTDATLGGGTNTDSTAGNIGGIGNGAAQTIQVFGRIPAGTTRPPAGSYNDTVAITIIY